MRRAAEVLLEPEGVRRDPPARGEAGARVASTLTRSLGSRGSPRGQPDGEDLVWSGDVAACVTTRPAGRFDAEDTYVWSEPLAEPLTAMNSRLYCHAGNNPKTRNVVAYATVVPFHPSSVIHQAGHAAIKPGEPAGTLTGGGTPASVAVIPFNAEQVTHPENRSLCMPGEPAHTLANSRIPESIACTHGRFVRRLTPRECERLQGFPDDWTLIHKASDAARYRALGNAVAVPVVEWIAKRLKESV